MNLTSFIESFPYETSCKQRFTEIRVLFAESVEANIRIGLAKYCNTIVNLVKREKHFEVVSYCNPANYRSLLVFGGTLAERDHENLLSIRTPKPIGP